MSVQTVVVHLEVSKFGLGLQTISSVLNTFTGSGVIRHKPGFRFIFNSETQKLRRSKMPLEWQTSLYRLHFWMMSS